MVSRKNAGGILYGKAGGNNYHEKTIKGLMYQKKKYWWHWCLFFFLVLYDNIVKKNIWNKKYEVTDVGQHMFHWWPYKRICNNNNNGISPTKRRCALNAECREIWRFIKKCYWVLRKILLKKFRFKFETVEEFVRKN